MNMEEERFLAFYARVGSHEYDLNTATSDEDFKEFVLPTFDDLYYGRMYANQTIQKDLDVDVHDIRKIPELFAKSNLNFLETLYSTKTVTNPFFKEEVEEIFSMKDQIVTMNLTQLYKSCRGMHKNKMGLLEKGTEGTQHLVDKFGYDTKQAQHAYRCLSFLQRFHNNGFSDFKQSITYTGTDKKFIMSIKEGYFTLNEFRHFAEVYDEMTTKLEEKYSQPFNAELKKKIDSIVYRMVRKAVLNARDI
jgi:uncharacterized protein